MPKKRFERYHKTVRFLDGLSNLPLSKDYMKRKVGESLYLKRTRYLLDLLGNPDKDLKFIHITGTAGKGTVVAMLHEIIQRSGQKVGSFTSPSVTTSIEKVKINEKYISPDDFADLVSEIEPVIDRMHLECPYGRPSPFEIFLAMAVLHFKRQKCRWVILEVGAGGRFDATNVIKKSEVSVITNIDYDHMEILGSTLEEIANDKAGIIKKGSVFFTGEERTELVEIFKKACKKEKVPFNQIAAQASHHERNFSMARAVAQYLKIKDKYINIGLKAHYLQARFEEMPAKTKDAPRVIIDGAHNGLKLKSTVNNLKKLKYGKLFLLIGLGRKKYDPSILKGIVSMADYIFFTRFQIAEKLCVDPKELANQSKDYLQKKTKVEIILDPERALEKAIAEAKKEDVVLVTGSFFLAGDLRQRWYPEEYILAKRKDR